MYSLRGFPTKKYSSGELLLVRVIPPSDGYSGSYTL